MQYLQRIGHLRLYQALPQRSQAWAAIRALRELCSSTEAVALLQHIAEELQRIMRADSQVTQRRLLNIEMRWIFGLFGWPYFRNLPDPCNF
ncbi:hypothetical protein BOX15_Mlig008543g1 [Macrostomum lignano]|uniref:Uncharacterized protein n=1 Tax=Macrostomum lignano TaxID=282301 RepID=A0A267FKX5_9PLAT|nr:hypothetical protein BOX15_Mlig008543g1 [Macrostomum lignano]